ncbi:MFS transporter [Planotetraspora kaengkrachanensis]|uniref:MFS transporter n=1 Tax=Planotetraspora kaengkrachanensis TaxID=575193 RepID=A0A8J3Q1N3_9ACTN|nr:MFS transporter [Planotetraspora kaengkrachanensis]GIG84892.1 MFS transporter [Planotetraspora kaengkrachanensis]
MSPLTPAQRWSALLALALGGFAIGLTEFVAMGLLPDIARSLLPTLYARSTSEAVAQAGWMISVYALGVVVGAPLFAALTARVPRKKILLGLLALFIVGTAASAAAPTFGLVLVARFVAALPHGAYFGAAGLVAASIMGPGSHGKGFAVSLGGLTVANVIGVPVITHVGQSSGWRVAYLIIAIIFALTLFAVLATVPAIAAHPNGSARSELRAFRAPQVWLVAGIASIGFGGFFAIDSYIAPVTTHVAGLPASTVPWVLVAVGLGMTIGNAAGGWASDRDLRRSMLSGFPVFIASMVVFALVSRWTAGLYVGAFLVGAASLFLGPALQSRLIQVAPGAQMMGAAVNQSAMNVANSLGALLGGVVIAGGLGYVAPTWVGVGLGLIGFALAGISYALESPRRRSAQAPLPESA